MIMLLAVVNFHAKAQHKVDAQDAVETKSVSAIQGPKGIVRAVKQDKKGNIWITSWEGVFKYDGKSFTNVTSKVSSVRFFSVLEDRKGNFWFGSIGSGVYFYDGKSFRNFTTKDGLAGNGVTCIFEDKIGNIWFGTGNGASCYNGKSFKNFTTREGLPGNDINSITEDKTGKFWFGMGGNACIYDGKAFTVISREGKPFINVRSIIEDKRGNIWLGGNDGLWRYDGNTFINYNRSFVGYIYEDKKSNIWISSERDNNQASVLPSYGGKSLSNKTWALSRYDGRFSTDKKPTVTEITLREGMICGVLEANDGSIWFGADDGVYRYDGNAITAFTGKGR